MDLTPNPRHNMSTNLTQKQQDALVSIATSVRVNYSDLGRTARTLIERGLIEKDWSRNDASGEALRLTESGKSVVHAIYKEANTEKIEYKVTFTYPDRSVGARYYATLEEAKEVARVEDGFVSTVKIVGGREITLN